MEGKDLPAVGQKFEDMYWRKSSVSSLKPILTASRHSCKLEGLALTPDYQLYRHPPTIPSALPVHLRYRMDTLPFPAQRIQGVRLITFIMRTSYI